jgi:hypothetical protein
MIKMFMINADVTMKAKAFKPGWIGSDIIQQHFFKGTYHVDSVILLSKADDKYKGNGGKTIIDGDKSDLNLATANGWDIKTIQWRRC